MSAGHDQQEPSGSTDAIRSEIRNDRLFQYALYAIAGWLILEGLTSIWTMLTGLAQDSLIIDLGILGFPAATAILSGKAWARTLVLLGCWIWFAVVPIVSYVALSGVAVVEYDLDWVPSPFSDPATSVLLYSLYSVLLIAAYAALTSRPGRRWFGLAPLDNDILLPGYHSLRTWALPLLVLTLSMLVVALKLATEVRLESDAHIGGYVGAVAVDDSYAYVDVGSRLAVVDISDPSSPVEVGRVVEPFEFQSQRWDWSVLADGGWVYAIDLGPSPVEGSHLRVVDTKVPSEPRYAGELYELINAYDAEVLYGYIHLVGIEGQRGHLTVYETMSGDEPRVASSELLDYPANSIAVADGMAYVTSNPLQSQRDGESPAFSVFQVFDVSDPYWIVQTASIELPPGADDVAIWGATAVVMTHFGEVLTIDMDDPGAPRLVGRLAIAASQGADSFGRGIDLIARDGFVYAAWDQSEQLFVIDITDPSAPALANVIEGIGGRDLALADESLVISGLPDLREPRYSLELFSLEEPESPTLQGRWEPFGVQRVVLADDGYDYAVTTTETLRRIQLAEPSGWLGFGARRSNNVADPAASDAGPDGDANAATSGDVGPGGVADAISAGDHVFVHTKTDKLMSLDAFAEGRDAEAVDMKATGLLAATDRLIWAQIDSRTLQIVDVSSGARPEMAATVELSEPILAAVAQDDMCFVAVDTYRGGGYSSRDGHTFPIARTLRFSGKSEPAVIATMFNWRPLSNRTSMALRGDQLFIGDIDGIQVFDINDPFLPKRDRGAGHSSVGTSMALSGNRLYAGGHPLRLIRYGAIWAPSEQAYLYGFRPLMWAARGPYVFAAEERFGLSTVRSTDKLSDLLRK